MAHFRNQKEEEEEKKRKFKPTQDCFIINGLLIIKFDSKPLSINKLD